MNAYIYTALGAMALLYVGMSEIKKNNLVKEVKQLESDLAYSKFNNSQCLSSITKQNKDIDSYKLDLETKRKELDEWKSKPTKVRYETIYRDVIKDNNLTGECDEVKDIINNVSSINLNSL
jgi:hypothetical protein